MRKITFFAALFISILFAACQNSDLELAQVENLTDGEQVTPLRETFDFTYNGESYSSPFYMENDTLMILEDEKVAAVYDRIQELPELATYVTSDGEIKFYDSYSDLQQNNIEIDNNIKPSLRGSNDADLIVYQNANYNDRLEVAGRHAFYIQGSISIPDPSYYRMDETISSFELVGSVITLHSTYRITFFRNKNYKAQSLSFDYKNGVYDNMWQYYYYVRVPNLKNYKVKKGITWNDRISSFKAFILN